MKLPARARQEPEDGSGTAAGFALFLKNPCGLPMPRPGHAASGHQPGQRRPRGQGHPRQHGSGHAPSGWANTGTFQPGERRWRSRRPRTLGTHPRALPGALRPHPRTATHPREGAAHARSARAPTHRPTASPRAQTDGRHSPARPDGHTAAPHRCIPVHLGSHAHPSRSRRAAALCTPHPHCSHPRRPHAPPPAHTPLCAPQAPTRSPRPRQPPARPHP